MFIQKIPLELLATHVPGPADPTSTTARATLTLERLIHLPFGAGIEEGQLVAFTDALGIPLLVFPGRDADFDHGFLRVGEDVEFQAGFAAVVDVEKVAVQLDVLGLGDLHTRPPFRGGDGEWRAGEAGHQGSRGERGGGDAV